MIFGTTSRRAGEEAGGGGGGGGEEKLKAMLLSVCPFFRSVPTPTQQCDGGSYLGQIRSHMISVLQQD